MRPPMAPSPTKPSVAIASAEPPPARRAGSGAPRPSGLPSGNDGNGADLELAPGMGGQARHLDGGRGRQMAPEIGAPDAIEVVLFGDVGEIPRGGDEVSEVAPRGFDGPL